MKKRGLIRKFLSQSKFMVRRLIRWTIGWGLPKQEGITNIFDYNDVIKSRPDPNGGSLWSNQAYGHNYILKRYSGFRGVINASIEHGPYLDSDDGEYTYPGTPSVIVFSDQRRDLIRSRGTNKLVFSIGTAPYYGKTIYDEYDLRVIKDNLGKTLLVYPIHDIHNFHYLQNADRFVEFIRNIVREHHYDTVLVCMYFVDIERGRHLKYQKEGWTIVSAGCGSNYDFCDITKSIISLADYAVFQSYTSAIGFCTFMNVPAMIYHQDILFSEKGRDDLQTDKGMKEDTLAAFETVFEDYNEIISKEKYDFCNFWFGFENTWSKDNLRLLFEYMEELPNDCPKNKMQKVASKKKYAPIRAELNDAIANVR